MSTNDVIIHCTGRYSIRVFYIKTLCVLEHCLSDLSNEIWQVVGALDSLFMAHLDVIAGYLAQNTGMM